MKIHSRFFILTMVSVLLAAGGAQARVFDMGKERFATYLKGSYSNVPVGKSLFENSSGTGMTFDNDVKFLPGYEFGFVVATSYVNMKFGFELITPPKLKDVEARNAAGTLVYTMSSDFSVAIPKVGLDINLYEWKNARTYVGGDWGMANLTVSNSYTFEPGQTQFPGMADFREETKASASTYSASVGYERLFFDTTTFVIEAGYRSLKFDQLKHNNDVTNFRSAVVKGDKALNDDGTDRTADFSGAFIGIQFRFWMY